MWYIVDYRTKGKNPKKKHTHTQQKLCPCQVLWTLPSSIPPPTHSTPHDSTRPDPTPPPLSFVHCNFLSLWVDGVWSLLCWTQVRTRTLPATSKVIFLAEYSVDSDAFPSWWWWWWRGVFYFTFFFPFFLSSLRPHHPLIYYFARSRSKFQVRFWGIRV